MKKKQRLTRAEVLRIYQNNPSLQDLWRRTLWPLRANEPIPMRRT